MRRLRFVCLLVWIGFAASIPAKANDESETVDLSVLDGLDDMDQSLFATPSSLLDKNKKVAGPSAIEATAKLPRVDLDGDIDDNELNPGDLSSDLLKIAKDEATLNRVEGLLKRQAEAISQSEDSEQKLHELIATNKKIFENNRGAVDSARAAVLKDVQAYMARLRSGSGKNEPLVKEILEKLDVPTAADEDEDTASPDPDADASAAASDSTATQEDDPEKIQQLQAELDSFREKIREKRAEHLHNLRNKHNRPSPESYQRLREMAPHSNLNLNSNSNSNADLGYLRRAPPNMPKHQKKKPHPTAMSAQANERLAKVREQVKERHESMKARLRL